jgi:alpha-tubulin suppressor-like RCC1 family protein
VRLEVAIVTASVAGCALGGASPGALEEARAVEAPFVEELAVGSFHTCARLRSGPVRCWGMGRLGQLGDGAASTSARPVTVAGIDDAVQIAAAGDRSCAVRRDGSVWCWGEVPELAGASAIHVRPARVAGWREVRQLALALDHDCAVVGDGEVWCRGQGWHGALGDGGMTGNDPVAVVRLEAAAEVAVGHAFSCARTLGGEVSCWGGNDHGQCGDAYAREHLTPVPVPGVAGARALAVGFDHACALLSDGTAVCWGGDTFGQRGDGGEVSGGPPTPVSGLEEATGLWAGQYRTVAVLSDGTARGWGREWGPERSLWPECEEPREHAVEAERERAGLAEPYCAAPAPLPLANVRQVVVGQLHACARTDDGQALCWGEAQAAGGLEDRPLPTPIAW